MPSLESDKDKEPRRLRLHEWHAARGAEFRVRRGVRLPWRYAGSEALPAAGLLDLSDHGRLELLGADRQRFLGGLITAAVAELEPGAGAYGFVTSIKGRVLADTVVAAFDDRLFLLLPPGRSTVVAEHLQKYIVADRVEVLPLGDLLPIALIGEQIEERLAPRLEVGAWPSEPWGCGRMKILGTEVAVQRHQRLGTEALIAWVSSSILESVVEEWTRELELEPVPWAAMEALRVEHGLPAHGIDFDDSHLAQESGIDAIDFTKGCYLGQEVIARLHYRGQAPKLVRRVQLESAGVEVPAPIEFDGRVAGSLTTVAGRAGLGMVQRRAAEPGTEVLVDGRAAIVREL